LSLKWQSCKEKLQTTIYYKNMEAFVIPMVDIVERYIHIIEELNLKKL